MGYLLVPILMVLAALVTLQRNAVMAFVWLWLPSQLLLYASPRLPVAGLPDIGPPYAVIYGIILGLMLKGGEPLPFRWSFLDTLMVALAIANVISGMVTEKVWTGVSVFGDQFFDYLAPYFLARIMFHSAQARRHALYILIVICLIIAFFALIEVRLFPLSTARALKSVGLFGGVSRMVLERWGFFRTQVLYCHPIDMGNSSILLACFISILAATTSVGLKNLWVCLGICAAIWGVFTTLSFTSYAMFLATAGLVGVMLLSRVVSRSMVVFVLCAIVAGCALSYRLNHLDLEVLQNDESNLEVENSLFIRAEIVQHSWPFVSTAGAFGYGNTIKKHDLDLDSVDNTYMLLIMRHGWVYLLLFLTIPFYVCLRTAQALGRTNLWAHRLPLTIAVAGVLGTMVAMYTVWFGFVYSGLWIVLLAMFNSMSESILFGPAVRQVTPAEFERQQRALQGLGAYPVPGIATIELPPRRLVPSRNL